MHLFKRKSVIDERIEGIQNKIYKEAFIISIVIAIFSIFVKFYLSGIKIELVYTEYLIIIFALFYVAVKTVWLGIYADKMELHDRKRKLPMSMKNILNGLMAGVAIAFFFGVRSSIIYGTDANRLSCFFIVFFAALLIYCPFFAAIIFLLNKIAKKISKKATRIYEDY